VNLTPFFRANQAQGSQPPAGSGENKATRVMQGSGLAQGAPPSRMRGVAATALRRRAGKPGSKGVRGNTNAPAAAPVAVPSRIDRWGKRGSENGGQSRLLVPINLTLPDL